MRAIEKAIAAALGELGAGAVSFTVERPGSMDHGDYATNAALAAAKALKKNPKDVAGELADKLGHIDGIEKAEIAGAGFINFFISREAIAKEVSHAAQDAQWGGNDLYKGKTVMVEYTSPNLFKPLHIGNLIGNILGESVARILEQSSAKVKRLNYPSDIGLTIAKGVWGLQKLKLDPADIAQLGKAYVAGNEAHENDEASKKEIEQINKALYENSNAKWTGLREKGIATSLRHLHELCERLGTKFDTEFFESQSGPVGAEVVRAHIGSVFQESEGATIFRGEDVGLHTRVFLNSQGLPTYEAKEVGLFELKSKA